MEWVFWAILVAAVLHVVEEYASGWLEWVQRFVPGVRAGHFFVVNGAFLALTVLGALFRERWPLLSLSIAGLLFINACIHVIPAIVSRTYAPGLYTALFLYLPLSVYGKKPESGPASLGLPQAAGVNGRASAARDAGLSHPAFPSEGLVPSPKPPLGRTRCTVPTRGLPAESAACSGELHAYAVHIAGGRVNWSAGLLSFLLGALWMAIPLAFQGIRLSIAAIGNRPTDRRDRP